MSKNDLDYYYTSARFYEMRIDDFGFSKMYFKFIRGSGSKTRTTGTENKKNTYQ
jgi:hypothetical protein